MTIMSIALFVTSIVVVLFSACYGKMIRTESQRVRNYDEYAYLQAFFERYSIDVDDKRKIMIVLLQSSPKFCELMRNLDIRDEG